MTHRGSGSGGPNPQVFVLITGVVALLGIPVGLMLAGGDTGLPAPAPTPTPRASVALLPAAALTPAADPPVVTVRDLPARPASPAPAKAPQRRIAPTPEPVVRAPIHPSVASTAGVTPKPRRKSHRVAKPEVAARRQTERRQTERRHASPAPAAVVVAKRTAPVERRTYAYSAPAEPRSERTQTHQREYASRETDAPREKPARDHPKRERSRRREASRPKEPEAFGAGNSGFHYGASYDPYSMHVGH